MVVEIGDFDAGEYAVGPVQRMQLVGGDEVDLAAGDGGVELGSTLRGGAEFGAAVDKADARRDAVQGQRPVDRAIAAAGDDDALAAQGFAFLDVVLHRTGGLERGEARERRAVGAEGAGAGGDDDGLGQDGVTRAGGEGESPGAAGEGFDLAA